MVSSDPTNASPTRLTAADYTFSYVAMLRFQRVVCRGARFDVRFAASQSAPKVELSPEEKAIREEKLAVSSFYNAIVYKGRQVFALILFF